MNKLSPIIVAILLFSQLRSAGQETCIQNFIFNNNGPIDAFWPMDGNGNDLGVAPANNPQGAIGAGVNFTGTPFAGTGSASFLGTGGLQYSGSGIMTAATSAVSFGAWIRPTTVTGGGNRIIFEEGGIYGFSIYLNTTGEVVFAVADGSAANSADARFTFPADGLYHHIAFNYNNGRLEIFLDGLLQDFIETGFGGIAAHGDAGGIGALFGSNSAAQTRFSGSTFVPFSGLMDEVFYKNGTINHGNLLQYARCHGRSSFTALPCSPSGFFIQGPTGSYNSINLVTGDLSVNSADGITNGIQNAIGFNNLDGLIYGSETNTGKIFVTQIIPSGSSYTYSSRYIAYLPSLQAAGNIIIGDVYAGKYYVRNGNANKHYIIDVNPSSATYLQITDSVTSSATNNFADWAVNPGDNLLYAISSSNGQLLRINPTTGAVTNLGASVPTASYGAVFFDNQGFFYVYNNTTGKIYRINIAGGIYTGVEFASSTAGLSQNDGARCANTSILLDFGDARDASTTTTGSGADYNQYATMLSNNGPRHMVNTLIPLRMGATVTTENDGTPNALAAGDTDDGIAFFPAIAGGSVFNIPAYTVSITVTNSGTSSATLYGWFDWNNNGLFETSERVSAVVPAGTSNGNISLTWTGVNLSGPVGATGVFSRFRISTDIAAAQPTGGAEDGEVEDYYVPFATALPVSFGTIDARFNGNLLRLNWSTLSENNNDHFIIEISKNGVNFTPVGVVKTLAVDGSSNSPLIYNFILSSSTQLELSIGLIALLLMFVLLPTVKKKHRVLAIVAGCFIGIIISCNKNSVLVKDTGELFVRIKQVDKDGDSSFSKVVKVIAE